jgi:tetratricopeptide (TPR) repeat protein/CheY-like chemotaxis protein
MSRVTGSAPTIQSESASLRVVVATDDAELRMRVQHWLAARGLTVVACIDAAAARNAVAAKPTAALIEALAEPVEVGDATLVRVSLGPPHDRADASLPRSIAPAALWVVIAELLRGTAGARLRAPSLPELLVALRELGETGVLEIRAEGLCTRVFVRDGAPVFAEGGGLRETLGRLLVRQGALSEDQYVRVIERMTERLIENEATRMGEVLVELGLLSPQEVFTALTAQVHEKILGCFRFERFDHHFEPRSALAADVLAYACPPLEALLLGGLREHFDAARVAPLLEPARRGRLRLRAAPEQVASLFRATPAEQRLLHALDGTRDLATLRAASSLDAARADQLLAAVIVADAVDLDAPAAAPKPARVAPPEPLPGGTRPVPARRVGSPRSLSLLQRELARAGKPAPRPAAPPPDARTAPIEAERAFRQGLALLAQPALPGAQRAFARACELRGDEPEYALLAAWVEVLLAKDEAARAAARARSNESARALLRRDPDAARAHAVLGQLAIGAGELDAAERHFRHALRVRPDDHEALRGMRTVERRRAESGSARKR